MGAAAQKLKYATQISGIKGCPPPALSPPKTGTAFRFAWSDKNALKNFVPPALIDPSRLIGGTPINMCCRYFALSFFTTLDNLRLRATNGLKTNPNLLKLLGDHFLEAQLDGACGLATQPSDSGHFGLFEFDSFKLKSAVLKHEPLGI